MDKLATRRVYMLARLAFVWAVLIVGRLIQLQIIQHGEYQRLAQQQQEKTVELQAPRGAMVDRWGQRWALGVPGGAVVAGENLSKNLKPDAHDLLQKLQWAVDNRRGFLWVKRRVTQEEASRL